MLDTPQIVQTTKQLAASIRVTNPREQIREAMGPDASKYRSQLNRPLVPATKP